MELDNSVYIPPPPSGMQTGKIPCLMCDYCDRRIYISDMLIKKTKYGR